jgi:hypothetical protein
VGSWIIDSKAYQRKEQEYCFPLLLLFRWAKKLVRLI